MSRPRTACTGCSLPFYRDTNESCPYCGTAGPTDARAAPGRERVTCPACGLPHYGESCPYCAMADGDGVAATRERITCPTCGLAHYADAPACPYCATAETNAVRHAEVEAGDAETEVDERTTQTPPGTEADPDAGAEVEAASADGTDVESGDSADTETPPPDQRRRERRQPSDDGGVVGRLLGVVRSLFGR
jgi:hypothetical protein